MTRFPRLTSAFERVQRFVSRTHPLLRSVRLYPSCREIQKERAETPRYFMHVLHRPNTVCTWGPDAEDLPTHHLLGLLLHEFAHLANEKGELGSDVWAAVNWGVAIQYRPCRSVRELEWVSPDLVRRLGI